MPPRKSGASTASAPDAAGDVSMASNAPPTSPTQHAHPKQSRQSGGGAGKQDDGVGIDDLLLPRSLVSRLSRGVLPPNTSLQKDALLALTRSATVFISYLAHHANEQSQLRHRKTLGVQDVYAALREIELAGVMEVGVIGDDGRQGGRLEREVALYEEGVMKKRKGYREKVKARESTGAGGDGVDVDEDRGEPSSKRPRRMSEDDEEERMLEQQLNGTAVEEDSDMGKRKSSDPDGVSLVVQNGHSKGKERADGQDGDEDIDEADEVEDDPAVDEEDEDQDDEADDDTEDEAEDEEAEVDADNDEIDDSRLTNGGSRGLLPNGEVEIGSDEESD
ncbi:hypothetical protein H2200_000492 [Cladophialophora chaetospira]|uniref:DNA polymerase epsilon subunit D n=1 Tax=Cladophialophora chaetospira TaxID=386627 RepID=A0AA38XNJ5_9EURO|nr:hypothetical protein H2200_000492 [Cladophialophora chaetospira]